MHAESIEHWTHDHVFGQHLPKPGERRTLIVIAITTAMMVVEIGAGVFSGSMALLADGLHMASHASALAISAFAYHFTRRRARDARFSFGAGKINSLAAFASAVLLGGFAFVMAWESLGRMLKPVSIIFDQAIFVAVLGLAVNAACLLILKGAGHEDGHSGDAHKHHRHDHNLWSAYLHVAADALTSVLAILALLAVRYMRLGWMDPLMGILGAILVIRWAWQLLAASSRVLLDMQAPEEVREAIRRSIERADQDRITDLHVWSVGPGIFAAEIGIVASAPKETDRYRELLPSDLGLVHVTIEARRYPSQAGHPSNFLPVS